MRAGIKMKKIITISTFLLCLSCFSQDHTLIIGKWEGTRKETLNGRKHLNDGRLMKELTVYEFIDKSYLYDYTFTPEVNKYKYTFKDSLLCFENLCFKVIKLTSSELVLLDYNPKNPKNPLVFKHFYVRSKKKK